MNVILRAQGPADEPFLRQMIVETIAGELGASAWPEPMRRHLLGIQYNARRHARRADSPGAVSCIIQADDRDSGWVVVNKMAHELRLVEIMVLPERRGLGIGAAAIGQILANAAAEGKPVRLDVNVTNTRARALYERLGFQIIGQDEVQFAMEKLP